ncbi:MAG: hypothetical protein MJ077_04120 [Oscillospiraceae bacterium]|nr:hypothetical protein [Oscillospiraceae bacterium]
MMLNQAGQELVWEGKRYIVGQSVKTVEESDYPSMFGRILEIRTDEDRETENETPDIYCEFYAPICLDEIQALEEHFSALYGCPKKLDDVSLDCVIMQPDELTPITLEHENRKKLWMLKEDWACNDASGSNSDVFTTYDDAKLAFLKRMYDEIQSGSVADWMGHEELVIEADADSYEAYLDGEYMMKHYVLSIQEIEVPLSLSFIREVSRIYERQCYHEDFEEHFLGSEIASQVTDEECEAILKDEGIPDLIEHSLECDENYWSAYWGAVENAEDDLVKERLALREKREENPQ